MYELGDKHYADGTRYHSSDRFEGTVYPCGCGEPFVSEEDREAHIASEKVVAPWKALFAALRAKLAEDGLANTRR